jgi:hypothetical protein
MGTGGPDDIHGTSLLRVSRLWPCRRAASLSSLGRLKRAEFAQSSFEERSPVDVAVLIFVKEIEQSPRKVGRLPTLHVAAP